MHINYPTTSHIDIKHVPGNNYGPCCQATMLYYEVADGTGLLMVLLCCCDTVELRAEWGDEFVQSCNWAGATCAVVAASPLLGAGNIVDCRQAAAEAQEQGFCMCTASKSSLNPMLQLWGLHMVVLLLAFVMVHTVKQIHFLFCTTSISPCFGR